MGIEKKTDTNNQMINFNDLPCDILNLIYKQNRSWTSTQINDNKDLFNEVINELDEFCDPDLVDRGWGHAHILQAIQNEKDDDYLNDHLMDTGEYVMCDQCDEPYDACNNNHRGEMDLCRRCEIIKYGLQ